jgi:hypothetical protein
VISWALPFAKTNAETFSGLSDSGSPASDKPFSLFRQGQDSDEAI